MVERVRLRHRKPWKKLLLILIAVSSEGCASGSTCPPLVDYSAERQTKAAKELRALPKGSELANMIVDYGQLRRTCRLD